MNKKYNYKETEKFIREFLELYNLNNVKNFNYIKGVDEDDTSNVDMLGVEPILDGSSNDAQKIERAAKLFRVESDSIYSFDTDELLKMAKKYKFFGYYLKFRQDEEFYEHYKDGTMEDAFLSAIFGENSQYKKPTPRFNKEKVKSRLIKTLKEIDKYIPETYHKGAKIKNLSIFTEYMFSFPQVKEMTISLINALEWVKQKFLYSLENNLSDDEIREFDFLVDALQVYDVVDLKPLYYSRVKHYSKLYREDYDKKHNFNYIVGFRILNNYNPWKAVEFSSEKDLAQRLVDYYPYAKDKMKEFSLLVNKYLCVFNWSDDEIPEKDELDEFLGIEPSIEPTHIYVDKQKEEFAEFADAAAVISGWTSPFKMGGLCKGEIVNKDMTAMVKRLTARLENPFKGEANG